MSSRETARQYKSQHLLLWDCLPSCWLILETRTSILSKRTKNVYIQSLGLCSPCCIRDWWIQIHRICLLVWSEMVQTFVWHANLHTSSSSSNPHYILALPVSFSAPQDSLFDGSYTWVRPPPVGGRRGNDVTKIIMGCSIKIKTGAVYCTSIRLL